jgi:hypothetical protein
MLRAVPKNWFSWKFEIFDGEVCVANLDLAWFREEVEFAIQGRTFEIGREGVMSSVFLLREDGRTIASATKPSAFRRSFEVVFDQTGYKLEAVAPFVRRFELRKDFRVVGSIHPVHCIGRKAIVELPEYLPLEVQLFIAWLVIMLWKRAPSRIVAGRSLHGN